MACFLKGLRPELKTIIASCWDHASSPKVLQEETLLANPLKCNAEAATHEASALWRD
jgi:hypothetical protein